MIKKLKDKSLFKKKTDDSEGGVKKIKGTMEVHVYDQGIFIVCMYY